ncbi:MAG TPA: hypothetical protein VD994_09655, partial [Prosthecobacter sp.]|nr:hypothetical protein [Prosthecobacter sp.]
SLAGVHSLTATGVGYAGTNDGAHVMMRQITGDGSVVARLGSLTGGATSIAGVSIRDSLYRGARRAVLGYMAGTGLQFRTRTTANATDTVATQAGVTLPAWVRLERNSATGEITASYAADAGGAPGVWTGVGVPTVVGMDNTALFGLTASSGSTTASSTAAFDNLALAPAGDGPALLTEDAGSGNPTAGTFAESNGTYTIGGSGALDGGGYFAGRQYVGDLVITAKLADATSGATSAKSGIMIRESLDSGAYVFLGRITSSSFSGYLWRTIAAGSGGGVPSFTGKVRWMRLVRQGNRVTAFHAPDVGGSPGAWIQLGQPQTVIMSPVVHVGFCVDNSGGVGLNVATFTNLTVVPLNKAPIINPGSVTPPVIATASLGGTVSDDGYPAPPNLSVLWNQLSGPAPVVFGNPSLPPTSAQFGADGPYRLRLSASDGSAETFADLTFDAYTRRYGVWQAAHFSGGSSNPDSGADADPDRDSLSNLLEYALATGPNAAGASPVVKDVVTVGTERFLRLTVSKNAAAPEVLYVVEATGELTNPASWSSAGLVVEQNDANTLRVRDHVPMNGGNRRFMRVWVHLP